MRPSNRTTLSMACEAVRKALDDAGLEASDIGGMTSYQGFDSCASKDVGSALGMRLDYSMDIIGGGSSTEALVAHAIGLIEAGYCRNMVIFRSMNGRSGRRPGGQDPGRIGIHTCHQGHRGLRQDVGVHDARTAPFPHLPEVHARLRPHFPSSWARWRWRTAGTRT